MLPTWSCRLVLLMFFIGSCAALRAAVPPLLLAAVNHLREQRSYSWEIINADPGPVRVTYETRRGTVTMVQQNNAPHVLGSRTTAGDVLLQRDWTDGMRLDTLFTSGGQMVTLTPEGWMTKQEILTAIAEERMKDSAPSSRYQWMRRADRPDIRRPDEELPAAVAAAKEFSLDGDSYSTRIRMSADGDPDPTSGNAFEVTLVVNVRHGVVRDYQLKVEGSRSVARAGVKVPLSDDRFVILTYLPVRKLEVPDEAWTKLKDGRTTPRR